MLTPSIVKEIRRLLADGKLSQRKIARRMRVSRGTVVAIASGKRPDYQPVPQAGEDTHRDPPDGPLKRCPECGGMVYMPCRLCATRSAMANRTGPPILRLFARLGEPLGLDLRGGDLARYEELRRQRELKTEMEDTPPDPWETTEPDDPPCEVAFTDLQDALELDDEDPSIDAADMPWFEQDDEPSLMELI